MGCWGVTIVVFECDEYSSGMFLKYYQLQAPESSSASQYLNFFVGTYPIPPYNNLPLHNLLYKTLLSYIHMYVHVHDYL